MNKPDPRKALGKGIDALMRGRSTALQNQAPAANPEAPREETAHPIPIDSIDPNPLQPRRIFETARLEELAQSIRSNGIIQPLVVRKVGDRYQLVAGERRWRAAKLAGIPAVPVVIREIPDDRLLEITLIENIQREDLNPIETGIAFARMARELSLTPDEIGARTGKDRSTVSNFIRLLQLPEEVQQMISDHQLTAGHGRSLLTLPTPALQLEAAQHGVKTNLSVRQLENFAQRMMDGKKPKSVTEIKQDPNVKAAIQNMRDALGTKVEIREGARGRGRIEIHYYSQDELDRIYDLIVGATSAG
ncbi:MAG: ParB/RepB/Spo0J family partition protein [Acidobacteriota bacterium]|nr:ParB/RepB/Spo0J family partition protein [Acidobacteriota bacterium]